MSKKTIAFGKLCRQVVLSATVLLWQMMPVVASESELADGQKNPPPAAPLTVIAAQKGLLELQTDEINDVAYALQRVRQQAINIYVEAIRKRESPAVTAELPALSKVPEEIPKDMTNLLPFRQTWLVYFITTLEPLVYLLKQDIKDIESGAKKLDIEPQTRLALNPLLQEWGQGVKRIDEHVSRAAAFIDDADKSNIELARIACEMDKEISKLEQIRDRCFSIVDEMEQRWKKYAVKTGQAEKH